MVELVQLETQGREALKRGAFEEAVEHFERALEHSEIAAHPEISHAYVDALLGLGRYEDAQRVLHALKDRPPSNPLTTAALDRKFARASFLAGDVEQGMTLYREALGQLGDGAPESRLGVYWHSSWQITLLMLTVLWPFAPRASSRPRLEERARLHGDLMLFCYWFDISRSVAHHLSYYRLARRLRTHHLLVEAYASHISLVTVLGLGRRRRALVQRARDLASEHQDHTGLSRVHTFSALSEALQGHREGTFEHVEQALEHARASGDRFHVGFVLMTTSWLHLVHGSMPGSEAGFRELIALGEEHNDRRLLADGHAGLGATLLFKTPEWEELEATSQQLFELSDALQIPAHRGLAHEVRGGIHFFRGEFTEAVVEFRTAIEVYESHALFGFWAFAIYFEYAEALLWRLDTDPESRSTAIAELRFASRNARRSTRLLKPFSGFDDVIQGSLHSRKGEQAQAESCFNRALEAREQVESHYLTGWLIQRVAIERFRMGASLEEVKPLLAQSEESFREDGAERMTAWVQSVGERLQAHL